MSNLIEDDSLIINHAQLRAPSHLQTIAQQQLLSLAGVPQNAGEYLFLRKVSVTSTANYLSEKLQKTFLEQSKEAVDGDFADAENAQAVRFISLGHLLAKLSQDIQAKRQGVWFWESWQHLFMLPTGEALAQLWSEYHHDLTGMVQVLIDRSELDKIWLSLSQSEADKILLAIHQSLGVNRVLLNPDHTPRLSHQTVLLKTALIPWQVLSNKLDNNDSRLQLAATLLLIRWRPDFLLSAQVNQHIVSVMKQLVGFDLKKSDTTEKRADGRSGQQYQHSIGGEKARFHQHDNSMATNAIRGDPSNLNAVKIIPDKIESSQSIKALDSVTESLKHLENNRLKAVSEIKLDEINSDQSDFVIMTNATTIKKTAINSALQTLSKQQEISKLSEQDAISIEQISPYPDQGTAYCQQGGIFYLLNFMARENTQVLLKQYHAYEMLQGPWGCLYRIAKLLKLKEDLALEQFIAYRMGLNSIEDLQSIPALSHAEHYQHYAEKLYGPLVWNSQLLSIPAHIQYSVSHLDIHYPLQNVQVEVRRVGLDINPGWLSWLGQVVHFHYHQDGFMKGGSD